MTTQVWGALFLTGLLCLQTGTARAGAADDLSDRDAREVRREIQEARRDLQRASQRLAEATREMGLDHEFVKREMHKRIIKDDRALIGVIIGSDDDLDTSIDQPGDANGVRILAVTPGGGAEAAGIEAGDVVVAVNGTSIEPSDDGQEHPAHALGKAMGKLEHGDEVVLEIERDGERRVVSVTAQRRDAFPGAGQAFLKQWMDPCDCADGDATHRFVMPDLSVLRRDSALSTLELVSLDTQLGEYFGTTRGLLVVHAPQTGTLDLRSGDVILRIGKTEYSEPTRALARLSELESEEPVEVEVLRKGERKVLQGTLPLIGLDQRREREIRITIND